MMHARSTPQSNQTLNGFPYYYKHSTDFHTTLLPIKHSTDFHHFDVIGLPFSATLTEWENAFLGTPVAGAAPSSAKCASSAIAFSPQHTRCGCQVPIEVPIEVPRLLPSHQVTVPPDATQRAGLQGPHAARTQTGRAAPALGRRL